MNMSPACTPPTHDQGTATERSHPRWPDYERYKSAMSRQMVSGASFASWLRSTEENENGKLTVFEPLPTARLVQARGMGWYVNEFWPGSNGNCRTHGPFPTREAAEAFRP